jgi:hypothetical protein
LHDLQQLKRLIKASGVDTDKASFGDVRRKLTQEIEAPFIKAKLNAESLARMLDVGIVGPVFLLFVIFDSLLLTLREGGEREFLDVVLLYRSTWGYLLGTIWILGPVILDFLVKIKLIGTVNPHPNPFDSSLVPLYFVMAAIVGIQIRVFKIRRLVFPSPPGSEWRFPWQSRTVEPVTPAQPDQRVPSHGEPKPSSVSTAQPASIEAAVGKSDSTALAPITEDARAVLVARSIPKRKAPEDSEDDEDGDEDA